MFLPIIIAMSASQNVYHAISGGALAVVAGIVSVVFAFVLLILLNSIANKKSRKER